MAPPPAYSPAHEFVADEAALTTLPGSELDIEFNALNTTLDAILVNLALLQRDDGALKNGIVTIDSLASDLSALLGDPASLADFQALVDAAEAASDAATASASAASTSAGTAATQASNASSSASSASTSAGTATTQASAAAASALAAAAAAGAVAFKYTWSTNNASSDPGSGVVKADTGTLGSIASLYISETDADGNSISAVLALLDDATNVANGKALIRLAKNATNWVLAKVTASVTDNGTWDTLTLTVVASVGSFSASDTLYLVPTLHGSDGAGVGDVTAAAAFATDNVLVRSDGTGKGVQASVINVDDTTGTMYPTTNDSGALGKAAQSWADLFLASGGVLNWNNGDVTVTHSSNALAFAGASSGYSFDAVVTPATNDGAALGSTALMWSDLFLASGGVINWNNGNVTLTHAAGALTIAGASTFSLGTSAAFTTGTIELGHASANTLSASSGVLSIEGVAVKNVGKETIYIPASAMIARTTNGAAASTAETTTNKVMIKTLDFDTSTQEFAQFSVWFPKSWNVSTITFQAEWSHAATTTDFGVVWALEGLALSDDDAMDTAFGTAQQVADTGGTTNDKYTTSESSAITIGNTPAAGDTVHFQVKRVPADGSDTMAIDARLHGIRLFFTTNAATDA